MPRLTQLAGITPGSASETFVNPSMNFEAGNANFSNVNEGASVTIRMKIENGAPTTSETVSYAFTLGAGFVESADYSISSSGTIPIFTTPSGEFRTELNFTVTEDLTTEGGEDLTVTFSYDYTNPDTGAGTATIVHNLGVTDSSTTPSVPTYILNTTKASCNEGESFDISLVTANVSNGDVVGYTITGVSSADIGGVSLTGNFVVGTTDSVTLNVTADATTETSETFLLSLDNGEDDISVTVNDTSLDPTYAVSASKSSANEGESFSVNLTTTDVQDGVGVGYTITGVSSADIDGASLTGSFTVNSNTATLLVNVTADASIAEGQETFNLALDNGADSVAVTIVDSSVDTTQEYTALTLQTATSVNEGGTSTFRITGRNIAIGTTVVATCTPVTGTIAANDFTPASITKTITWGSAPSHISHYQDFNIVLSADEITEGSESYKLVLASTDSAGTSTGDLESPTVTIGDTSLTPVTGQKDFPIGSSWTVPAGVTSISILCIGGGGGGGAVGGSSAGGGGAGGSLSYANNVSVTPGETLTATVGAGGTAAARNGSAGNGGASSLSRGGTALCSATGGGGATVGYGGSAGSSFTGSAGYYGGNGGAPSTFGRGCGGGGAAGYSGSGGDGQSSSNYTSQAGSGQGGGGGGGGATSYSPGRTGGGGVGIYGSSTSGAGGTYNNDGNGGSGGSAGDNGPGGAYGGGGSGSTYTGNPSQGGGQTGSGGFVRLLYPGTSRAYPSTRTINESAVDGTYDSLIRNDAEIQEFPSALNDATVTFTLSTTDVPEGTTVGYSFVNVTGTVTADDFINRDTQFTIGSDGTATVSMQATGDWVTEGTETFKIQLASTDSVGNDTEDLQSPNVAITDDYPATVYNSISLDKSVYNEGEVVTISVNYTNNTDKALTVGYTVASSSGSSTDFDNTFGVLNLLDGNTYEGSPYDGTKTTIAADLTTEGVETMTVTLNSTDSNGNATNSRSATAQIADSSQTPRVPGQGLDGYIDKPSYGETNVGLGYNPEGTSTAWPSAGWCWHMAMTDDFIIVGDPLARGNQNTNSNIGQATIYNRSNKTAVQLIDSPYQGNSSLGERQSRFGSSVGIGSNGSTLYAVVLCGYHQNAGNSLWSPKICIYASTDNFTNISLHKIVDVNTNWSSGNWVYGHQMSVRGNSLVVGDPNFNNGSGTVRYCQLSTSSTTLTTVQQVGGYRAGERVDINPDTGFLTYGGLRTHEQGINTYPSTGISQRVALSNNSVVQTKSGWQFAGGASNWTNFSFGCGIADGGDYYAVASGGDDYNGDSDQGRVRFFQSSGGSLRATINNPVPEDGAGGGPGKSAAQCMRGNANGQIAVLWVNVYDGSDTTLRIYNASNGTQLYTRNAPGSTTVGGGNGSGTWDLEWDGGSNGGLAISESYVAVRAGVPGYGIFRIYIY